MKQQSSTKVLFMHGLESGIQGNKHKYLDKHFKNVHTPDMQMSIYRFSKKHSVVRNILRNPIFLLWALASIAGICVATWISSIHLVLCAIALSAFILVFLGDYIIAGALAKSLQQCVNVQTRAVQEYQPDVIVGSSWGGLVGLICIARGIYQGPLIAIAPPTRLIFDKIRDHGKMWQELCGIESSMIPQIYIVQGDQDETVPLEHTQEYANATRVALEIIPGGDHSLNSSLIDDHHQGPGENPRLKQAIFTLLQQG